MRYDLMRYEIKHTLITYDFVVKKIFESKSEHSAHRQSHLAGLIISNKERYSPQILKHPMHSNSPPQLYVSNGER